MMKKTGTEAGSTGRALTKVLRRLLGAAVVLMALCLVLAVPATATGTPDTSWYDASQNEFVIDTADELAGLAVLVNNGDSFEGKTVSLGADIDLSGYPNWTPIGNATHAFSGKFHGKTYGISNLYISLPENEYVGLFGNITNEINGIHLSDSFVAGYGYVGSIAGIVNGGSIVDCIVENFIVDGGGHSVGGMAGEICDDSSINACIITDGRIDGNSYVGSVVGTISRISSCSYCIISNCTVAGDYTTGGVAGDIHSSSLNNITISSSTVTGVYDSGGLGGMFWTGANWPGSSAKDCVMNNCTITGSGITGHLWNSEVQNCTLNSCTMSVSGIADMVSTGVIDNCTLRDCTIDGESFLGGIGGTVSSWSRVSDCILENCTISSSSSLGGIVENLVDSSIINCTLMDCNIQSLGDVSGVALRISHSPGVYNSTHIIDCTLQNCRITGECLASGVAGDVTSTNIDGCVLEDCTILGEDLVAGVVSRAINTTVHACEVIDCTITGIDNDVGGIGGYIYDGSSITSCLVENSVISGTNNVGGISGKLWEDSTAGSCAVSSCSISSKDIHVGGVVGDLWNSDVYDATLINGTIIGKEYVGGLIGGAQGNVSNCSVTAEITGTSYVGGITGSLFLGTVSNCISLVQYIDTDGTVPGRIDNSSSFGFVLLNNYAWKGMTSNGNLFTSDIGPNEMNGASVSSSELWNNQSFFEDTLGWDFENTWMMNSGNDKYQLPVLQFQDTPVAGDATYLLGEDVKPTPTPTPGPTTAPVPNTDWYDANETEFVIYTADELAGFAVLVNNGTSFKDKTVSLGTDIDLSGYPNWTPIGTVENQFNASFDGKCHIISNLSMDDIPEIRFMGLFGIVTPNTTIKNCYIENIRINLHTNEDLYVGGIVGSHYGLLENCRVEGNFSVTSTDRVHIGGIAGSSVGTILDSKVTGTIFSNSLGSAYIGGIVGSVNKGTVRTCYVSGLIDGDSMGYVTIGGIVGYSSNAKIIEKCSVESIIRGNSSGEVKIGGIAGTNHYGSTIDSCYTNCSIFGSCNKSNDYSAAIDCGGIAGWNVHDIRSCYSVGNISVIRNAPPSYDIMYVGLATIGGIVGYNNNIVDSCYAVNSLHVTGFNPHIGGIVGYTYNGLIQNNYALNNHLIGTTSNISRLVGTISEEAIQSTTISNNYGWDRLQISRLGLSYSNTTDEILNGFDISATDVWNNTNFCNQLGSTTWKMNSGNDKYQLPVLQFQDAPVAGDATYLLAEELVPTPTPDNTSDFTLNLSPGWNFISIPKALDASNATALALFGSLDTAGNAILGYNAETQSWEQITADSVIKPLSGYWVYSVSNTCIPLTYSDVPTTPGLKSLYPGWNAVGLSADTDTSASTFFAGLNWRVALPWNCENGMYDSAIVNGGGSGNSPDRLLSLGNGCWLYVEEANVLPGLTA